MIVLILVDTIVTCDVSVYILVFYDRVDVGYFVDVRNTWGFIRF